IVVGVIERQSGSDHQSDSDVRRIISYGHRNAGDARPLDGDTVFEIASVTKVFTALLLADMVEKKEVALSDPASKYLPGIKLPERNGRSITLVDLATHTSGLPFMPADAPPLNDPAAAKYSAADLKRYLASYQLTGEIGADWEYSNIGYWVLSEALATRAGNNASPARTLIRQRVLIPLKMTETDFELSEKMKSNLAPGHDNALQPAPAVSAMSVYSIMPAGGGLYSTANDLLTFLSECMGYQSSPLAPAMKIALGVHRPVNPGNEQALGWNIYGKDGDQIIFRDGSSFGYASAIAYDPMSRVGVVVLTNQIGNVGDIARHLLRPNFPLAKPANKKHIEIALDPRILDSYVGRYEAKGEGIFIVARENDFLTLESPADWGLPKLRIRPESQHDFFATELPVKVTFQTGPDGKVRGLTIYPPRGQKGVPAIKLAIDFKDGSARGRFAGPIAL
ncbi:MAG TPA: serine hydrolase, partial [Chthoniobacterales bacterium]|nr:serine hydrolase [Chthoniobacterales bacterium]